MVATVPATRQRFYSTPYKIINIVMGIRRNRHSAATWQRWLVLIGVCFDVAVCSGEPTTTPEPIPTVLVLPNVAAGEPIFSSDSGPTFFFPKQRPVEGEGVVMEAELFGELTVLNRCLRVNSFSRSNTSYLLVWPPDFRRGTERFGTQVLNGGRKVAARVGEEVFMGGGEVRYAHRLDEYVQRQLPADCTGPYWIGRRYNQFS